MLKKAELHLQYKNHRDLLSTLLKKSKEKLLIVKFAKIVKICFHASDNKFLMGV